MGGVRGFASRGAHALAWRRRAGLYQGFGVGRKKISANLDEDFDGGVDNSGDGDDHGDDGDDDEKA